ncbi:MAG TPA: DUF742 domain-containing protein [Mycobacteriales bacterium]|nr:DUF742 domain-containing protein [Mycobacteriales bacterium]
MSDLPLDPARPHAPGAGPEQVPSVMPGSSMLRKAPPAWVAAKAAEIPQQPEGNGEDRLVRSYVVTGGRTRTTDVSDLVLESLVVLSPGAPAGQLQYEKAQIAALCHDVLSVAEIAAHTKLPLGVTRVLLADMLAEGFLDVHVPSTNRSGSRPDAALLEKVLDGLRSV